MSFRFTEFDEGLYKSLSPFSIFLCENGVLGDIEIVSQNLFEKILERNLFAKKAEFFCAHGKFIISQFGESSVEFEKEVKKRVFEELNRREMQRLKYRR